VQVQHKGVDGPAPSAEYR